MGLGVTEISVYKKGRISLRYMFLFWSRAQVTLNLEDQKTTSYVRLLSLLSFTLIHSSLKLSFLIYALELSYKVSIMLSKKA